MQWSLRLQRRRRRVDACGHARLDTEELSRSRNTGERYRAHARVVTDDELGVHDAQATVAGQRVRGLKTAGDGAQRYLARVGVLSRGQDVFGDAVQSIARRGELLGGLESRHLSTSLAALAVLQAPA